MSFVESVSELIATLENSHYVFPSVSMANGKLKSDNIATFSLPAIITCHGAGICKKFCYATCGNYNQPCVKTVLARNYVASKRDYFVFAAISEIARLPKKIELFRVHDSGDFYSTEYVKKWNDIAMAVNTFRKMQFYAYTKAFSICDIVLTSIEINPYFSLIQSYGSNNDSMLNEKKPHAHIFTDKKELVKAGYTDCSESDLIAARGCKKVGLIIHGQQAKKFNKDP
jgi:hypothetical protein